MNRPLALFFRTWALGITAWALVYTREVPTALAQSVIETDCSTDLDQPDTTYILTSDAANCIIAAANIILDGQNLYEISGDVRNNAPISGQKQLTLRNLAFVGQLYPQGFTSNDVVSIENSTVHTFDGNYMYAAIDITDSIIEDFSYGFSGGSITRSDIQGRVSSWGADLVITDSSITGVGSNITVSHGDLTMIDSYTNKQVETFYGGTIIIDDSTVNHDVQASGDVTIINNSETGMVVSEEGDITVTDSIVGTILMNTDGRAVTIANSEAYTLSLSSIDNVDISVTDSTIQGPIELRSGTTVVTNSTVNGNLDTYNYANATVTDSTIHGEISMYTGYASVTRSLVEGDIGRVSTLLVEDSTVTGDVNVTGTVTLIDNAPSLIVTPLTLSLSYGEKFNPFEDVTAHDVKDGDLSADVTVIGEAGQTEGVYELQYSVTDTGTTLFNIANGGSTSTAGPNTTSITRTITRGNKPTQSTSIGVHKERKEKQVEEETALSSDTTALIETLRTTLEAPGSTNDPEALKDLIDLVKQLIVALLELLAAQGKVK